jgi:hypothetical protein
MRTVIVPTKRFWYLRQHPITEDVIPTDQVFHFNSENGAWELPPDQPSLPHFVGVDFYDTREEAISALRSGEWKEEADDGETAE